MLYEICLFIFGMILLTILFGEVKVLFSVSSRTTWSPRWTSRMLGDKDVRQRKPPAPQPQFADFPRNEQLSFSSEFWHWLSWPYIYCIYIHTYSHIYIYIYIYNYSNMVTHEHKYTRSKWPTHISSPIITVYAVYVYIGITASSFKCHRCWNFTQLGSKHIVLSAEDYPGPPLKPRDAVHSVSHQWKYRWIIYYI